MQNLAFRRMRHIAPVPRRIERQYPAPEVLVEQILIWEPKHRWHRSLAPNQLVHRRTPPPGIHIDEGHARIEPTTGINTERLKVGNNFGCYVVIDRHCDRISIERHIRKLGEVPPD